jgi:K+-sensing histidine kinase KdpD
MRTNSIRELLPKYVAAIVAVIAIGAVDWVTGPELTFFVFYFLPVAMVSWRINAMSSYVVGLFCALVWFLVDRYSGHMYTKQWIEFWNVAMRLIAFIVIGYMVGRIQSLLAVARKEVKILSGLLPICAKCKKIRDDKGYWHHIESYISEHSEADFTHGLCERCFRDTLRETGFEGETCRTNKSTQFGDRSAGSSRVICDVTYVLLL